MSDSSSDIDALLAGTDFSGLDVKLDTFENSNSSQPNNSPNPSTSSGGMSVDMTKKGFEPITKFFNDQPSPIYSDQGYYKTILSNGSENANKLHAILTKYLTTQDAKDKAVFRQQIVTIYWEFLKSIVQKITSPDTQMCKKMLVRYGIIHPSLFSPEQKDMFSKAIYENTSNEPVYYLDEWFTGISTGEITLSATDEARPQSKAKPGSSEEISRLTQLKTKNNGKLMSAETMLCSKENERAALEGQLRGKVEEFCTHETDPGFNGHKKTLTEEQKRLGNDIADKIRSLLKVDKEIIQLVKEYSEAKEMTRSLEEKLAISRSTTSVDSSEFLVEFDTVRQMAKMTVGRMGNHFPIFTKEFFHCMPQATGFRENVLRELAWVENLDPGVFCRVHKNVENRIVPYVILIPTYGDSGFCWEPFDRFNRVSSRGRIVVPMYPKSLQTAVILACADLRWQVAKEKASYYWMEEGLTGNYYQWFEKQKLKGDVKDFFIQDYILWLTKEAEGVQRLDKEVRAIFWRHMPFPQERKELLKTRSLVYQELFQRDTNRSLSDGY